jgi:hypothetical protein
MIVEIVDEVPELEIVLNMKTLNLQEKSFEIIISLLESSDTEWLYDVETFYSPMASKIFQHHETTLSSKCRG